MFATLTWRKDVVNGKTIPEIKKKTLKRLIHFKNIKDEY